MKRVYILTYLLPVLNTFVSLIFFLQNGPPIVHRSTPSLASIATNRQPITARSSVENDLSPKENVEKNNNNDEYFKQAPVGLVF